MTLSQVVRSREDDIDILEWQEPWNKLQARWMSATSKDQECQRVSRTRSVKNCYIAGRSKEKPNHSEPFRISTKECKEIKLHLLPGQWDLHQSFLWRRQWWTCYVSVPAWNVGAGWHNNIQKWKYLFSLSSFSLQQNQLLQWVDWFSCILIKLSLILYSLMMYLFFND